METPLDCLLVDKHCDKYIAVLVFAIVRVNTMCFIMLAFVKEVLVKLRVLLI